VICSSLEGKRMSGFIPQFFPEERRKKSQRGRKEVNEKGGRKN